LACVARPPAAPVRAGAPPPPHDDVLETRQLLANLRYQAGDPEGAAQELELLHTALARVLLPTHDRITKVKRDIAFLQRGR
ncbi:hypothetical protein, partial [Lentzea sp. NPDC003310]|uniref:hypothetical protein n=1 Tax=Lentzea sp. NPDC003310 TaxID=3154447 RepID=UPI0033A56FAB